MTASQPPAPSVPSVVALCPHPPLLLPELAGRRPVAADLLLACRHVVAQVSAVHSLGVVFAEPTQPASSAPPLGLRVARRLLGDAGRTGALTLAPVAPGASGRECARVAELLAGRLAQAGGSSAVLVMADGSARRSEKAPGHLDPRARAFDDRFLTGVRTGDRAALAALEPDLADQLWFAGRAALAVMAALPGPARPVARVAYADDPFGVLYVAATWS